MLQGLPVLSEVDTVFTFKLVSDPVHDALVEIVASKMCISGRRLHFKNAVADIVNRDIKRPAPKIEDQNRLVLLFIQPIGERSSGGFVDDSQYIQAGHFARIFRSLPLGVSEVRGDCEY